MIHVGVNLKFCQVEDVLAASVLELERNKEKLANPSPKDDVEQIMVSWLYLKIIFFFGGWGGWKD